MCISAGSCTQRLFASPYSSDTFREGSGPHLAKLSALPYGADIPPTREVDYSRNAAAGMRSTQEAPEMGKLCSLAVRLAAVPATRRGHAQHSVGDATGQGPGLARSQTAQPRTSTPLSRAQ